MAPTAPLRRYGRRFAMAMLFYVVSLLAGKYLVTRGLVDGPLVWVLALLPGLAVASVFYAIARLIIELQDEFIRMLVVRQTLIATGATMAIASVWGFFESYGLVPHADAYWVAVLWFAAFGFGALLNRLRYGTSGGMC